MGGEGVPCPSGVLFSREGKTGESRCGGFTADTGAGGCCGVTAGGQPSRRLTAQGGGTRASPFPACSLRGHIPGLAILTHLLVCVPLLRLLFFLLLPFPPTPRLFFRLSPSLSRLPSPHLGMPSPPPRNCFLNSSRKAPSAKVNKDRYLITWGQYKRSGTPACLPCLLVAPYEQCLALLKLLHANPRTARPKAVQRRIVPRHGLETPGRHPRLTPVLPTCKKEGKEGQAP